MSKLIDYNSENNDSSNENYLKHFSNWRYDIHDKLCYYDSKPPDKVENINYIDVKNNNLSNILNVDYNSPRNKINKNVIKKNLGKNTKKNYKNMM